MDETMTDKQAQDAAQLVTFEMPAGELARGLANGLLFAAKELHRPILAVVRVACEEAGKELTFVAIDSYGLIRTRVSMGDQRLPAFSTLIDARDAAELAKALKPMGAMTARVTVGPEVVAVEVEGRAWTFRPVQGDYPRFGSLWPTSTGAVEGIGLNPVLLARLAKVVSSAGKVPTNDPQKGCAHPVTFGFVDSLKVVTWSMGSDVDGLMMPVRPA